MSSREAILANLGYAHRHDRPVEPWKTRRRFEDPVGRFEVSLAGLKGEVRRAESLDGAWDVLGIVLDELKADRCVANQEPPIVGYDLVTRYPECDWHLVGQSEGDLRAACAAADVGLSGVSAALVETGSLIVESGEGQSRLATLLPTVHIVMVPESKLTTDLHTWSAEREEGIATNVTVISGPSKTADIEFTLTLGAHGPKRVIAILYAD
ncbi:MAG: hypothetical protein CME19_22505 [Gemmatimonadetes bacterium]|nr:hypothetical protein [Gemmatimonadota bacterium]|tara:strand:- start:610 stop:1239 length:630 start_codon:yes stop_codon:yes gene_type:complete